MVNIEEVREILLRTFNNLNLESLNDLHEFIKKYKGKFYKVDDYTFDIKIENITIMVKTMNIDYDYEDNGNTRNVYDTIIKINDSELIRINLLESNIKEEILNNYPIYNIANRSLELVKEAELGIFRRMNKLNVIYEFLKYGKKN